MNKIKRLLSQCYQHWCWEVIIWASLGATIVYILGESQ